ncbi:uncharacterized protein LOC135714624 [Ochlerotatus camptorhynchus]|uniref:uncharacterized protein LOC135714624 n=1 Tax=Ochlerotatus camptorhynchus TaxID=644619 RepID=UPI0031D9A008
MTFREIVLWCDSTVVLAWIKKPLNQLQLFVRNRIAIIQEHTSKYRWEYVRSQQNPADIVSRGQLVESLKHNSLWWNGPEFLQRVEYYVDAPEDVPDEKLPELKALVAGPDVSMDFLSFLPKLSNFRKIQRVVGYVLRFTANCRKKDPTNREIKPHLTVRELRRSSEVIMQVLQKAHFPNEIKLILANKPCKRLGGLRPIYHDGLLRVGGRLDRSQLPFESRHPIILPDKDPVVLLLIQQMHVELLHVGPDERHETTLLVAERKIHHPIYHTPVREMLPDKSYHSQPIDGKPASIESSAVAPLRCDRRGLRRAFLDQIEWNFIPPDAPEFGGLWEAAVKSAKTHLKRVVGNTNLTFEELCTILSEIEAVLNSRPLFAISNDPADPLVITPAHYLIGRPLIAPAEPSLENVKASRLTRWQHLQLMREQFWRAWSRDYLNTLQLRKKNRQEKPNIREDMIVLLHDRNQPPLNWKLGRIVAVYPGTDGLVRAVDVFVNGTTYRRPINKVSILPIEDNDPHQSPPTSKRC